MDAKQQTQLKHQSIACKIQTSAVGGIRKAGTWETSALYQVKQEQSSPHPVYSCFMESSPKLYVQAVLQWQTRDEQLAKGWLARKDQVLKFWFGDELVLEYTVDGGAKEAEIRVPGVWSGRKEDMVKRFQFQQRKGGSAPQARGSIYDLAAFRVTLHYKRMKGQKNEGSFKPASGPNRRRRNNTHPSLSERIG